jgi:hypothetical protein
MSHLFENLAENERYMLTSAYNTIHNLEAWEFLKSYEPPENTGFMFDSTPQVLTIINAICDANPDHSGFSIAYTMRKMQQIAKENKYQPILAPQ